MNNTLTIDSSVLISALGNEDQFSKISKQFFTKINVTHQLLLPSIVVAECVYTLWRSNPASGIKSLEYLSQFEVIGLDITSITLLTSKFRKTQLKTSDTIIAITASLYDSTLVTWDKQLLSVDKIYCPVITPSMYLEKSV